MSNRSIVIINIYKSIDTNRGSVEKEKAIEDNRWLNWLMMTASVGDDDGNGACMSLARSGHSSPTQSSLNHWFVSAPNTVLVILKTY